MADISKIQLPSGGTYNIKDANSIHAPSSPTSGDVLSYNGSAWVASANAGGNVFLIELNEVGYPLTSASDILQAISDGKALLCIQPNNGAIYPVGIADEYEEGNLEFNYFVTSASGGYIEEVWFWTDDGEWETESVLVDFDDTGAVKYSERQDLTDSQMIVARENIGAFAEPENPTTGDVLLFQQTGWEPTSPSVFAEIRVFHIENNNMPASSMTYNVVHEWLLSGLKPYFALTSDKTTWNCVGASSSGSPNTVTLSFLEIARNGAASATLTIHAYSITSATGATWTKTDTTCTLDVSDVLRAPSNPSAGDVLTYSNGSWVALAPNCPVYIGTTAPSGAVTGTLWLDTSDDESVSTSVSAVEDLAGGA